MFLLSWRAFTRDVKMIRNTFLIGFSFFSVYMIGFISNALNEYYKESLNSMTIYLVESITSFSIVQSVVVLLIYLIIVLLEIRYDKNELLFLGAIGYTRKQIIGFGTLKYTVQLLIAILFSLLFFWTVSIIAVKVFSSYGITLLLRTNYVECFCIHILAVIIEIVCTIVTLYNTSFN